MTIPASPPIRIEESPGRRAAWDYLPSRTNDCPGYIWIFDKAVGRSEVKGWICGSVQHLYEPCSIAYAQREIDHLNECFHRYDLVDGKLVATEAIYFVECEYDAVVLNRLNQRRAVLGGGMAVVRRGRGHIDGQCRRLHMYSNRRYPGSRWPTEVDWLESTPDDAIARVAEKSLMLPGVFSAKGVIPVTYSGDWERPARKRVDKDQPNRFITMGKAHSEHVLVEAQRIMAVVALARWGLSPMESGGEVTYFQIPAEHQESWVETTWSVVGNLNSGKSIGEILAALI